MSNVFADTRKFTELMRFCTKKPDVPEPINRKFIRQMVEDELKELDEAKDETEEIDALLDAVYYILQHLSITGLNMKPIWDLIHNANMRKFGPGGYLAENGKWMKPKDFVPPDDAIRAEIENQREMLKKQNKMKQLTEAYELLNNTRSYTKNDTSKRAEVVRQYHYEKFIDKANEILGTEFQRDDLTVEEAIVKYMKSI